MDETKIRIETRADLVLLRPLSLFLRSLIEQLPELAGAEDLIDRLELAFIEAITNIHKHAYPSADKGPLCVEICVRPSGLEFRFEDYGKAFDPDRVPLPDLDHPGEGGLGIWLMRSFVDEFAYRSEDGGKNILTLVKHFPAHQY